MCVFHILGELSSKMSMINFIIKQFENDFEHHRPFTPVFFYTTLTIADLKAVLFNACKCFVSPGGDRIVEDIATVTPKVAQTVRSVLH